MSCQEKQLIKIFLGNNDRNSHLTQFFPVEIEMAYLVAHPISKNLRDFFWLLTVLSKIGCDGFQFPAI